MRAPSATRCSGPRGKSATAARAARVRNYYSAAHLPQKIDFWVGGRIDEIRYDRRLHRIDVRFPAAGAREAPGAAAQCAYTTLQFRQQNGLWLLSGGTSNLRAALLTSAPFTTRWIRFMSQPMTDSLLIELFTEELPPKALARLGERLRARPDRRPRRARPA